jgi:hypothetical protein
MVLSWLQPYGKSQSLEERNMQLKNNKRGLVPLRIAIYFLSCYNIRIKGYNLSNNSILQAINV